jgi:hypothetical protein
MASMRSGPAPFPGGGIAVASPSAPWSKDRHSPRRLDAARRSARPVAVGPSALASGQRRVAAESEDRGEGHAVGPLCANDPRTKPRASREDREAPAGGQIQFQSEHMSEPRIDSSPALREAHARLALSATTAGEARAGTSVQRSTVQGRRARRDLPGAFRGGSFDPDCTVRLRRLQWREPTCQGVGCGPSEKLWTYCDGRGHRTSC